MSCERMCAARSLWILCSVPCVIKNEFKRPTKSCCLPLFLLPWMPTKNSILLRFSSSKPSIKRRAYVTNFSSPLTLFTISKNNLMYSSAWSFWKSYIVVTSYVSEYVSLLLITHLEESLQFVVGPTGEQVRTYKYIRSPSFHWTKRNIFPTWYLLSKEWSDAE